MAFVPYTGNFRYVQTGWLGSAAIVQGGVVRFDVGTGYIEPAVAASAVMYGVNMGATQTASSTNGATTTPIIPFESGQVWVVDTTTDNAQTETGTLVSLTDAVSMDNDDTGNTPLFECVGHLGALADRKGLYTPHMANFTAIGV
jgi:hypothetical protein